MDGFLFTFTILLAFALILGIPIGISYFTYKFINRRNIDRRFRLLSLIPLVLVSYLIYDAIYPSDNFYKDDFKEVTGLEFPKSANIQYKIASFPDHFGDYTSISIIDVEEDFFQYLQKHLIKTGFEIEEKPVGSTEWSKVMKKMSEEDLLFGLSKTESGGKFFYVGFYSNKRTILVERLSW